MKRSRATAALTGGTGDVNPQWFVLPALTSLQPNVFNEISVPTPISRLNNRQAGTKATVLEVLKIEFSHPNINNTFATTFSRKNSQVQLGTSHKDGIAPADGTTLAYSFVTYAGTIATDTNEDQWVIYYPNPITYDLTDGAGHGVLVASDKLYFGGGTLGYDAATNSAWLCRILYRFKDVGLTEYIGMVQSQQSG